MSLQFIHYLYYSKQTGLESNYLVVLIVYLKLLKCPVEDNIALMTAHICQLEQIMKQLSLWSVLMTASYFLSVFYDL